MANGEEDGDGDGNGDGCRQAMVDGKRNGNGRWRQQWATTTAMVTESAMMTEMAMVIAMATAMARVTMTKAGLPLHVPAMCSAMAGATPCLHPHGHKGKCIHQCCVMKVTLLRVFPPFQGGGLLTAHHGFFFVYYLQLLFSLLNNPLFSPRIIQPSRTLSAH
jgi:hypothetical protein